MEGGNVDKQARFDAVSRDERHLERGVAADGVFAGERLVKRRNVGKQEAKERLRRQFRDAPAAARGTVERAVVARFHKMHTLIDERPRQPIHPPRLNGGDVCVEEHHDVSLRRADPTPQRFALAGLNRNFRLSLIHI